MAPYLTDAFLGRLWSRIDVRGPDECHPWIGNVGPKGYGRIYLVSPRKKPSTRVAVTRVVWEISNGPIPDGMFVLHQCDNPPCCNINHLFLGSNQDNTADRQAKERQARGERHADAKLTNDQVIIIREMLKDRQSYADLARRFGVSPTSIRDIGNRKTWRHI